MKDSDVSEHRVMLEDIVGAYLEHGDGPGLKALLMDANGLLIDNAVSHRHEGWEGPSEACPICRYENRIAELEAEREKMTAMLHDLCKGNPIARVQKRVWELETERAEMLELLKSWLSTSDSAFGGCGWFEVDETRALLARLEGGDRR